MVTTEFERHAPRVSSQNNYLRSKLNPASTSNLSLVSSATPTPPSPSSKDVIIDRWVSKIFSIIKSGPSGGFVSYAIGPRNDLYVVRTGNRREVEDVVNDLLPPDACRYVAYNFRYKKFGVEQNKVVWFVWTPEAAPKQEPTRFLSGLASTLIGLNCEGTIPIINAKALSELDNTKITSQIPFTPRNRQSQGSMKQS